MQVQILKSKVHKARVTGASVDYEGSLTIASDLMEKVGLVPYEKILCGNMGNGERFETYVIPGAEGSGAIELNGATAHLGKIGDQITIMAFALVDAKTARDWKPRVVVLNEDNTIKFDRT
ncbi:MAG: aspartate 1-decarboxylase [Limisphaerales bacterium]|jgi:aspartate 1-decarboxylase